MMAIYKLGFWGNSSPDAMKKALFIIAMALRNVTGKVRQIYYSSAEAGIRYVQKYEYGRWMPFSEEIA